MSKLRVDQLAPTDDSVILDVNAIPQNPNVNSFGATDGGDATSLSTAFQAAIDALPSTGGTVDVFSGDYTALVPSSLVIATNKMVTWNAYEALLPDNMPGMIVRSGFQAQPYESSNATGSRPGAAFQRNIAKSHIPAPGVQSQQDSVIYIEGHSPTAEVNVAQEFAGLRWNMSSKMYDTTNVSNPDIKGVNGIVVGDTGNAKVRSIRTTSAGINGHYGLVTGIMAGAHRSGPIPTQAPWNGNGTDQWTSGQAAPAYLYGDAAMIAQVGPGIQANIRIEGFAGAERPQFGILQARGGQACNPEVAVLALHGGGNGRVLQIVRSDSDTTEIGYISKAAEARFASFSSGTTFISDDQAVQITPPSSTGFIDIFCSGTSSNWARLYFRVDPVSPVLTQAGGIGSATGITTGPLNGTSATDGQFTISADATTIFIENRTGQTRGVCWNFTCSPES